MEPNVREIHFQSGLHELFDVRLPIHSVPKDVHGSFSLGQQVVKKHRVSKIGIFRPLFSKEWTKLKGYSTMAEKRRFMKFFIAYQETI